jgi:putative aminopeptidase FrvX
MIKYIENQSQISLFANNSELTFQNNIDYSAATSNNISFTGSIIFVGYGFTDEKSGYDDYKGIDIKNKIIIRLSGYPGYKDKDSEGYKKFSGTYSNDYTIERNKNKKALEKGALAVVTVSSAEEIKYWNEKVNNPITVNEKPSPKMYDYPLELLTDSIKNKLIHIYAAPTMMNKLLENTGINISDFEKRVASTLKPESKILKDKNLKISCSNKTELINARNVLGVIEGENKDEIIVIGGHYDHLGANDGFVWNGADDNASGTVGVWMLAKAFAASGVKPKKTIVFAAWTGEERGLLGSEYFADKPYGDKIEKVKLYVNYDMISKDSPNDTLKNQARLVYTKSFEKFETMSAKNITDYNLNLKMIYRPSENPRGGSDHSSFSAKNVPIMYFMAGFPTDYHTPTDETDDINWNKMVDIIKLTFLNVWEIANE